MKDPRQQWRVLYPLPEILLLVLCATLSGMEDFVEIRLWGAAAGVSASVSALSPRSAQQTLADRVHEPDSPGLFQDCFLAWVRAARPDRPELVAIDGKTSRRSHDRAAGRGLLHLVSAWAARQHLVLGQKATDVKSNGITAIPRLLERLELAGALVTIDAMGTQTANAETILAKGGDYLLALEANRPATHDDVARFLADPPAAMIAGTCQTTDNDHGRMESRLHCLCQDVAWLFSDRRYSDEPQFLGLAMIGMVETAVERGGRTQHERRYYLSSAPLDAETFARAVRAHWGIENRLHWVLDVVFHDDLARLRSGHGPQNMDVVRHIAMNLIRKPIDKHSLKVRRERANLDPDYL